MIADILAQPVVAVLTLLGVLIFVHEFGHFIVGKMCGIGVEIFSIGFGPAIISFQHRHTIYRLSVIPLGGFVKFAGALASEDVAPVFRGKEMHAASLWARALTILAGPGANFLLAIAVFTWIGASGISHAPAVVGQVLPGSAAEDAGLLSGDQILSVDGEDLHTWEVFRSMVSKAPEREIQLRIQRSGEVLDVPVTPQRVEAKNLFGNVIEVGRVGIGHGFMPAIVTIIDQESLAYKIGMRTGDRIKEVRFLGEKGPVAIAVTTWAELGMQISLARDKGLASIDLVAEQAEDSSPSIFVLKLPQQHTENSDLSTNSVSTYEAYARSLGLMHSGLTIAEVNLPNKGILQPNDQIVALDGQEVTSIFDLAKILRANDKEQIEVKVRRQGEIQALQVGLTAHEEQAPSGKKTVYHFDVKFLGELVSPDPYVEQYESWLGALAFGMERTAVVSSMIVSTLWGLITGSVPVKVLGGPIMIAQVAQESVKRGLRSFFEAMALISVNLAVINLFPIPMLDGGQFLLVIGQFFRRRPLSEAVVENFQKIGFVMVMALIVLATYNDISRYWASMVGGVAEFFQ